MLKLEIVTPERRVIDAEVDGVTVPTASGEVGILASHAPLVSAVKPGVLSYSIKGASEKIAVASGFVEVNDNKVAVLVDTAETADEVDIDGARSSRQEAEKAISAAGQLSAEESEAMREAVVHADARIAIASGK
ncbi:MAG: F0F1 ATP synthase subunit epsilon [Chloracidobacterium sp.]|nr:F0F1 ATP synthase subunit epsilon [Chloracidobacterium sp.]